MTMGDSGVKLSGLMLERHAVQEAESMHTVWSNPNARKTAVPFLAYSSVALLGRLWFVRVRLISGMSLRL